MVLTNNEKQKRHQKKMKRLGMKELRGVKVPIAHHDRLKDELRAKVKELINENNS